MVKTVADYVDQVQAAFPDFTKSEINRILTFGLRIYAWVNKMHADVLILNPKNLIAQTGRHIIDPHKKAVQYLLKYRMKERVLYRLKKTKWDGYYYVAVSREQHEKLLRQRIKTFKNVCFVKVKKELYHNPLYCHIWRIPIPEDCGWKYWINFLKTDQAEYIGITEYDKHHQYLSRWYNK